MRYRHATAYNTEKESSAVKDPTSHTNTEAMLQCYAMYQSCLHEYFCREYFCPPFGSDSQITRLRKFCDIWYFHFDCVLIAFGGRWIIAELLSTVCDCFLSAVICLHLTVNKSPVLCEHLTVNKRAYNTSIFCQSQQHEVVQQHCPRC